jgi:hypothetical protein
MTMTSSDTGNAPPGATAPPACPQCRNAMRIRLVEPVMFAGDLDDMTYRCEACGTEAKRTVRRKQA